MDGRESPDLREMPTRGVAEAPGSCGELVQGSIDGVDFLVTCPVNMYSRVSVTLAARRAGRSRPPAGARLRKTHQAVRLALAWLGLEDRVVPGISVDSSLPRGRGMGSSTADISAAVAATCAAAGKTAPAREIARIALSIEPTDGTMFAGIVQFDHRFGRMIRSLGSPPPADILILDPGGEVDTLMFNANPRLPELNRRKERDVAEALLLVEKGLKDRDTRAVGQGCTLSALAHQSILPKPGLDEVIRVAGATGAAGVNVAHSGTVMGMLYDPQAVDLDDVERYVRRRLPWARVRRARLVGGGVEIRGAWRGEGR